jgi:Na+-translocating ferredoxin:NAD+ oxidoreductase RnfG subunit
MKNKFCIIIFLILLFSTANLFPVSGYCEGRDYLREFVEKYGIGENMLKKVRDLPVWEILDKEGKVSSYLLLTPCLAEEVKGYGGPVAAGVVTDLQLTIRQVVILSNNETSALTAQIKEQGFLRQYEGKKPDSEFTPGKDLDGITGATMTVNALNLSIKESMKKAKALLQKSKER